MNLTSSNGAVTRSYDYDAFGSEKNPDTSDTNPFRYCGEYFDKETGSYYLRARYYDPLIGRFTQQDTHWNTANMIYGDNPQKINEREDALWLKSYSYAPQSSAVMQSGNLYVYGLGNPVLYRDSSGNEVISAAIGASFLGPAGLILGAVVLIGAIALAKSVQKSSAPKQSWSSSTPASPPPPKKPNNSDFKNLDEKEISRRYNLKNGEFHREIKGEILKEIKNDPTYAKKFQIVGDNPDIYLNSKGQIKIVSRLIPGKGFETDYFIDMFF